MRTGGAAAVKAATSSGQRVTERHRLGPVPKKWPPARPRAGSPARIARKKPPSPPPHIEPNTLVIPATLRRSTHRGTVTPSNPSVGWTLPARGRRRRGRSQRTPAVVSRGWSRHARLGGCRLLATASAGYWCNRGGVLVVATTAVVPVAACCCQPTWRLTPRHAGQGTAAGRRGLWDGASGEGNVYDRSRPSKRCNRNLTGKKV